MLCLIGDRLRKNSEESKEKKIKIKYYVAVEDALELRKGGVKRTMVSQSPRHFERQVVAPGTQGHGHQWTLSCCTGSKPTPNHKATH